MEEKFLLAHLLVENRRNFSVVLQDITKVLLEDIMLGRAFRDNVYCNLGVGTHIRFWLDPWLISMQLHIKFPRLFALAADKKAVVRDCGSFANGVWVWDLKLRRRCFGWEEEGLNSLLKLLEKSFPTEEGDTIVWAGDANRIFTVKALCSLVEHRILNKAEWVVPEKVRKVVPPKVVLFVWQLLENRVAVKSNLISRGLTIEDGGLCSLCGLAVETTSHLFLTCNHAWSMLSHVLWREGVQ